ncbi:MAG: hypothetical protein R6X18_00015 [Chloroflexota bacterium]
MNFPRRCLTLVIIGFILLVAGGCNQSTTVAPAAIRSEGPGQASEMAPPTTETEPVRDPDPILDTVAQNPASWPAAEPGTITVDAGQHFGPVSPWVYGTNYDPGMVVPVALTDAATTDMGIRFLRFPGGSYGDLNLIRPEQYDAFFRLAGQLGAEPHIHVRYLDHTPADAAETVRRINIEGGRDVRWWAIGNEAPYFYPEETAESYALRWREFAEAMLAVDPTIRLAGPDYSQFGPASLAETRSDVAEAREWMRIFLEANGDLLDLVTFHRYPYPIDFGFTPATIAELRPVAAEFDESIPELRAMIRETTGRDIPIGLLELNVDSSRGISGEATADSPFAAVWLADVLGRLIRQGVPVVAHYAFQTPVSRGGWGLLERFGVRPQYYVYQLYKHFGDELVYAAADAPDLGMYAAVREDGALTVMLVNLADEPVEQRLRLTGHPGGLAEVYRIDDTNLTNLPAAPDGRELLEPVELADGSNLVLPPRSATLLVWP